jgi:hypothetical protein
MANLRRKGAKNGLGKDPKRAAKRAAQLAEIDPDWDCPWPLNWQRHYRVLADLVDADGHLPYIAPGVLMDGDDIGTWRWRQQEPGTWAQLLPEQRERLTKLGIKGAVLPVTAAAPAELRPAPAAALKGPKKAGSKAKAAFQRGLAALAQWVEKEGQRPVPRGAVVEVTVDGETEPVPVKRAYGSRTPRAGETSSRRSSAPPSPRWGSSERASYRPSRPPRSRPRRRRWPR